MDKIEQWIRRKLSSAVSSGIGDWGTSATSNFGKSVYRFANGSMTLTLSELGFNYAGPTTAIERRYDEVEALQLASLETIMRLRGDLDALVTIGVMIRGETVTAEMRWPFRVYSNVITVLDRIVKELA